MDYKTFYENTATRHLIKNDEIPKAIPFVSKWSRKSRIQFTYEMLAPYKSFSNLLDIGCGDLKPS